MAKQKVTLSKDLPGQVVYVPEELKSKSYYKYMSLPINEFTEAQKAEIRALPSMKEGALEPEDRTKLMEEKCFPEKSGVYRLKRGGVLVAANVKVPDITGEMLYWWGAWHGLDRLRYAIWNPHDHYNLEISDACRAHILDPNVPVNEKLHGVHHKVLESFDQDEPAVLEMDFLNPFECGFDSSLNGTDRCMAMLCAKAKLNGKIPVFMTEVLCKGEDGVNETRIRFWIGYEMQPDGSMKCKVPRFIKIPEDIAKNLMIHNFKEYSHLNTFLADIYAEEKDNWE